MPRPLKTILLPLACTGTLLIGASPAAAGYAEAVAATPGLGSYWRLGEEPAGEVTDSAGNRHGEFVGGGPHHRPGADGLPRSASAFDGAGDHAVFGDAYDHAGRSPFAITVWIRPSSDPATRASRRIIGKESRGGGYRLSLASRSRGGKRRQRLVFERRSPAGGDAVTATDPLAARHWQHVAITYDGRTLRLFVDGRLADSAVSRRSLPDTIAPLRLGGVPAGGGGFRGRLDDVAVHRRALSPTEVARLVSARTPVRAGPAPAPATTPTPGPLASASGKAVTRLPMSPVLADADAAARVRRSAWEPRPLNTTANFRVPTDAELAAFRTAADRQTPHAPLVTGRFAGTTDELIQWTAHKWGFDEDVLRAQAAWESAWRQSAAGDGGVSFGLMQIKSTVWRGTAPLTQVSTPFNLDMHGAILRQCYDGHATWLGDGYRAGDLWGCLAYYYSGVWRDAGGEAYVESVKRHLAERTWERPDF